MSINLSDELHAATTKGKLASAKEVYLDGDQENLQQVGEKTHQLEEAVANISVTGGASTAHAVSYDNSVSGLNSVTAQDAIDKLAAKNKEQDAEIAKKANTSDVNSKMQTEQSRVNTELDKKFDKSNVAQELGDSEEQVVSQAALPLRYIQNDEFIFAQVDAEDHLLFGIQIDGTPVFGKNSVLEDKLVSQVNELSAKVSAIIGDNDGTNIIDTLNEMKKFFASISNTQTLSNIINDIADLKKRMNAAETELTKKFDKENIAQELGDSEDKVVSQFALPFRIEESEEFLYLIKDGEDQVLFGIQQDGSVEWQVGIPSPIRAKIQEIISQSQQDKTDLSDALNAAKNELNAALQAYKQTTDAAITSLQDTKVTKEEGKSLIDDEVKEHFKVIENDEWFNVMVDAEDHILFGIKRDTGKPYFPLNEMYHVEQNEEFFALWLDAEDHILMGIRRDGQIIGEIHAVNALKESISAIQNNIETLQNDVNSVGGKVTSVEGSVSALNTKVSTIDSSLKELLNVFSLQENPEFMAIETDAEGKIMAYRNNEGVKYENELETKTLHVSNLNLKDNSVNDILSALIANGFNVKAPTDWSESSFIQIPEPRFAIINITNIDSMPTTKTQNKKAFLEFWDMHGNYFKKHVVANAQGNSSMGYVKKNAAFDFCDDEWIGDATPKIRFGNWVPQDSFHMKAYYTDFFRGVGVVSYKLYDQIVRTRGNMYDRPWKKALLDVSKIDKTTKSFGNPYVGDYNLLTDTGARCFPDGFPVACYLNGKFYGIFSWQLKKHRDNYHMDKSTAEHVHLDGALSSATIFNGKDNINWSQFEIRNPKGLYAIGGNKYDADIKQEEIAGDTEVNAWIEANQLPDGTVISSKIKKALQMTAKVKKYIQNFADAIPTIKIAMATYEASSKTNEDLQAFKRVYETYFDADNMIDYMIVSDIIKNADGFNKNWQWFTYDGKKWWVGLYDCDMSFGGHFKGYLITDVLTNHFSSTTDHPNGYVVKYYNEDMIARYKELADKNIISASNIFELLKDWTLRIGTYFFKEEYKKWYDSPCIADSIVRSDYWELMTDEYGNPQTDTKETFNATMKYNVGDEVSFGLNTIAGYFKFKCIKETVALETNTMHTVSSYSPIQRFQHCDNLYRAEKWIKQNTANMDQLYKYSRN